MQTCYVDTFLYANNKRLSLDPAALETELPVEGVIGGNDAQVLSFAQKRIEEGQEDAFVVVDLDVVKGQLARWKTNLPRVAPWYAIKCHPDERLMSELFQGGCGFDAASIAEMKAALALGCKPEEIIFANPCKQPSHIRFAAEQGIRMMTFDNVEEMRKIKKFHPNAQLVMRILGDDSSSVCKFNAKFGVGVEDCITLLREAKRIGSDIVGVSFHVGSGCRSADAFVGALENARRAFDLLARFDFEPRVLDLGGGWPGSLAGEEEEGEIGFEEIADKVRPALDRLFPEEEKLMIIAEPGRYFAHACAVAFVNITSKRAVFPESPNLVEFVSSDDDTDRETDQEQESSAVGFRYYVNDGVYGTFNAVICDHRDRMEPFVAFDEDGKLIDINKERSFDCTIWGSTCDGLDKISASVMLPDIPVGSWFVFKNMGAYTTSAASAGFNGFPIATKYYL